MKPHFWMGLIASGLLTLCLLGVLHIMSISLVVADNRPRGYYNEVIPKEAA